MDLREYSDFVKSVTSKESNEFESMIQRLEELKKTDKDVNISLLLTSALGLSAETGEFTEVVKKIIFQSKPLTEENKFHIKRELGDILWYYMNAARSLSLDPYEIIEENIRKLKKRYPSEKFEGYYSENRQTNDL
jgi:NTP pyrophosphatase (non-canonical NTP hydrolase)